MNSWADGPLLAIDFETTGIDPHTARPITCALVKIHEDRDVTTVVNVMDAGVEIPDGAAAVHGWTTERLHNWGAENPVVVMPIISDVMQNNMEDGIPLIVFNARYDLTLMNTELIRCGLDPLEYRRVIDPMVIDKAIDTYRPGKRKLMDLCEHYKVKLDGAHDAGFDAIAAARLAWRMGSSVPEVGEMDLDELHEAQIDWALEQAQSFKAFLAERYGDTERRVAGGWPVETGPDDDVELLSRKPKVADWDDGGYGYYGGGYG